MGLRKDYIKGNVLKSFVAKAQVDNLRVKSELTKQQKAKRTGLSRGTLEYKECIRCKKSSLSKSRRTREFICKDCINDKDIQRFYEMKKKRLEMITRPLTLEEYMED